MVVIQEHKTYFLSSRLHLPHGVGEVEPTTNFRHTTYVNINEVSWNRRLQHTLSCLQCHPTSFNILHGQWRTQKIFSGGGGVQ
jgi:hypothetical protein